MNLPHETRRDWRTPKQFHAEAARLEKLAAELHEFADMMEKHDVRSLRIDGQTKLKTGVEDYIEIYVDNVDTAMKKEKRRRESGGKK